MLRIRLGSDQQPTLDSKSVAIANVMKVAIFLIAVLWIFGSNRFSTLILAGVTALVIGLAVFFITHITKWPSKPLPAKSETDSKGTHERLQELDDLASCGMISEREKEEQRKRILSQI